MIDFLNIANWVKKKLTRRDIGILFFIVISYFGTRLIFLDGFPIFSDEGIYIRWAKIAQADATWRFISLTDGKQPLQTWGTIPLIKLFADNVLFAGRLFSVLTGFFALAGIFTLLAYLWGRRAAYWGSFFYVFTPYFLFYDRMALVDSGVNAFFIWILFLSILLARTRQLSVALIFGLMSGLGLLAKSSAQLFVGLAIFGPILFWEKNLKQLQRKVINFLPLYAIGVIIAIVMYNIQRLSPFMHFVAEKNKTFVMTPQQFLETPFRVFFDNAPAVPLYVVWESGFVLPILGFFGFIMLYKRDIRLGLYLTLWILIPYVLVSFFSIVLFPRYIIFLGSLMLIGGTYFIIHVKKSLAIKIAFALYFIISTYFNYTIVADYKNIPFPQIDRGQYLEAWPAGWGTREIVEYARDKSREKPVILIAEGNFGMAGDVLDSHLRPGDKITIRPYWPFEEKYLFENQKELENHYVYIVFPHTKKDDVKGHWPVKLIEEYKKPAGDSSILLYELTR